METKAWYLSKTVWATITAFVVTVASIAGHPLDLAGLDDQIVTAIAALIALYGRVTAITKIGG